jgi:glycosyltransferase involved in cell wall biosynthesis
MLSRDLKDEFPTVLAAGHTDEREGELSDPEVPIHRVPLTRPISPIDDMRALLAVQRLLKTQKIELLHTHMAKAGFVGRLAARCLVQRPRTVHTFHGHVLDGYFSKPLQTTFIALERSLARMTDALVAVSSEVRDQLMDLGIGRPHQYHVLPVGLDLEPYLSVCEPTGRLRAELRLQDETPVIGVIGRLVPIKDHSTLFEAMFHIPCAHLAVLGDGELRGTLEAEVARMGLSGRVHFMGWREDLPGDVVDLDVVALTSRNEGTPTALIEALAAAKPVVSTDVGGVRSVVQHEVSGLLAPPGDAKLVADHILRLLGDRSQARKMAQEGRLHVARHFGAQRLVEEIRELYRSLL